MPKSKGVFIKRGGALWPYDPQAQEIIENMDSQPTMVAIQANRNARNHSRYFKMIDVTFHMQDFYPTKERWREYLQMSAGHYKTIVLHNGKPMYYPMSIAWDELDEPEFKKLFSAVIDAILKYFRERGQHLDENQLNQIMSFV